VRLAELPVSRGHSAAAVAVGLLLAGPVVAGDATGWLPPIDSSAAVAGGALTGGDGQVISGTASSNGGAFTLDAVIGWNVADVDVLPAGGTLELRGGVLPARASSPLGDAVFGNGFEPL
jgi:hypothetical protein